MPQLASDRGWFGRFGGQYVAETLMPALAELERAMDEAFADASYHALLSGLLKHYVGRPTPLYFAERLSHQLGARIYLKREDLCHTGAHKVNNTVGQVLLAERMGKRRVIAETGAGQHGVATATACALRGLACEVFMGEEDVRRQAPNVKRMELLGAKVTPVTSGARTLKDATSEALRNWVTHVDNTYYCLGSAAGPHPYPTLVRRLQSVIGRETRAQCLEITGRLPDAVVACVGGGSNAIGMFAGFVDDAHVRLVGVEAAGEGTDTERHAATLSRGQEGILHGMRTFVLADEDGQIKEAHSVSAGLDYPGVGPEHAWLKDSGRASYVAVTDEAALAAFHQVCRVEGIIGALETVHAMAYLPALVCELGEDATIVVNFSGRGDKDLATVLEQR